MAAPEIDWSKAQLMDHRIEFVDNQSKEPRVILRMTDGSRVEVTFHIGQTFRYGYEEETGLPGYVIQTSSTVRVVEAGAGTRRIRDRMRDAANHLTGNMFTR